MATIGYRRPLGLGACTMTRTWIQSFVEDGVRLAFAIDRLLNKKRSCEGYCDYALIALTTGWATPISEEFRSKYRI